jgi:hypothetical protein
MGKIADFSIKPMEQYSFLVTGLSRYTLFQPLSGGGTVSTVEVGRIHRNTIRTRPQNGRAVDTGALVLRSEPLSSNDNGRLSDSDSESSNNDDECSSKGKQGRSSTSKYSRWSDLDKQCLVVYKKEDKSWEWIFCKFPGRTRPAIRIHWNIIRPRGE